MPAYLAGILIWDPGARPDRFHVRTRFQPTHLD